MASIRCPNCNLLNFATEPACKKCRQPLGENAPEAAYAGYGMPSAQAVNTPAATTSFGRQQPQPLPPPPPSRPTSSYFNPPPPNYYDELRGENPVPARNDYSRTVTISVPPVCVKCGTPDALSMQKFKKDYTPPIAYIGILGGILPLVILVLILRKQHKMNGLFCAECWGTFKLYSVVSALASLLVLGLLFGGIIVALVAGNPYIGVFGVITAIGIGIFSNYYTKKISPKFVKMNRKQIYIKIPNYGEVEFTNTGVI